MSPTAPLVMSESAVDPLFVEYLRQGQGADFDGFCRAHPAQAARLRELKLAHDRAASRLQGGSDATIPVADSDSKESAGSPAPSSGDLLRRIVAQGAKGARYSMRGEIARGGMGAILKVWDEDLGRELAMKVVLGRDGQSVSGVTPGIDGRRVARFLEEAQVTGQLDHPCIVPVHELGLDSHGQVYFTMRLVRGRDLDRIFGLVFKCEEGWTETRALNVMLRVCEAMALAHSKGVVHRDLKPANVMVGNFGEVYVMDWGLARVQGRPDSHDLRLRDEPQSDSIRTARRSDRDPSTESAVVTMEGEVIGTPAYMPPEQARGTIDELSTRSDVYALGAMLYHLLARRMPYARPGESKSGLDILRAVLDSGPQPLRELRPDVPAELEAICEKAMARNSDDRYADTLELADDLRAFLDGRVVKAYQTGAIVELRKWVKRNKPLAAAAGLAVVFLIAGLATSLYFGRVAGANATLAEVRATESAANEKVADEQRKLAQDNARLAEERAAQALASAQRSDAMREFLQGMLAKANPRVSMDRDVKVSTVVAAAVKQLDDGMFASQPEAEYGLRTTLAETYESLSLLEESERQLRIAEELQKKLPSTDPMTAALFDIEFADTLLARAKYAEVESRSKRAMEVLVTLQAEDSVPMARALHLLSSARYNQGSMAEALELMRRALAMREKIQGPDHQETAIARLQLAFFLGEDRRLDEALDQLTLALKVLQDGTDRGRFEAAQALRQRASVYETMRNWSAAETDLREALSVREALLGEESIPVADILNDLPMILLQTNKREEAEEMARRALELRRKLLGEHRDTATSLTGLAMLLSNRGEFDEAREMLLESLTMRRKIFGPDGAGVGDSLRRLGKVELDAGHPDAAEPYLKDALANWKLSLGENHVDLALIELDLAGIHRARGEWAEARQLYEQALSTQSARYGEASAAASDTRDRLVTTLLGAKDWSAAERVLRDILPKYEADSHSGSPKLAYTGAQLGAVLVGQKKYDEAEPLLLAGWKAIGDNPRMWAVNKLLILDNLIELYAARGDEASAALYREKAAVLRK